MDNPFDPDASLRIARQQIRKHANAAVVKGSLWLALMGFIGAAQISVLISMGRTGLVLPLVFASLGAVMGLSIRFLAARDLMDGWLKYLVCVIFCS